MSSILSGVQEMSQLQNDMQDALLDLADVVTTAAAGLDWEDTDSWDAWTYDADISGADSSYEGLDLSQIASQSDYYRTWFEGKASDGEITVYVESLTGNNYGEGGEGLNAGDALLLEYDKNFISTQSEIANVMGKALTEVQSNINTKLQYLAR